LKHTISILLLVITFVFILTPELGAYEQPLLLIADRDENMLYFVNAETLDLVGRIKTGHQPQTIVVSPDGKTAYVANHNDPENTIMLVDLVDLVKIRDIKPEPFNKPHDMAITADGKRMFVTCEANRVVVEMNLATDKVTRAFKTKEKLSHMLALSPDEKTIYTANTVNGSVCIIDVATGELKTTLVSGPGCEAIAISPDGSEVWAGNRRGDTITIIDTQTRKVKEKIDCRGYPLRIKFTPDGKRALVTCPAANRVAVFDSKSHEEITTVATKPVPVGIDITPDGKRAFTANNGEPSITVIDLVTMEPLESFPIGKYPFAVTYVEAKGSR
jgi:YVTN family beta-propeller protein